MPTPSTLAVFALAAFGQRWFSGGVYLVLGVTTAVTGNGAGKER